MIIYDERLGAFLLNGKNYSYAMYINRLGMLQNLHFGAKIDAGDLAYLVASTGAESVPSKDDPNRDCAYNVLPSECGFFGHGDYREPTVFFTREDGASMSRLRYLSHKIYEGVPHVPALPHARKTNAQSGANNAKTLSVTLKDDSSPTEIILNYTVYDDSDVLVRNLEIRNAGKETLDIGRAYSFCFELPNGEYSSLRLGGRWAQERIPGIAPIAHGITKLSSLRGASSHTTNPFMGILKEGCTEDLGECFGVQLIYSGSFSLMCEKNSETPLRVQGGISEFGFSWLLSPGETFVAPQAAIAYSGEGIGGMSRAYADFLRAYVITPAFVNARRPILINNWEATYFDFDNEKLFPIIDEAARLGLDTFVLDDGWFGARNDDRRGLGDWFVNDKKLEGGLDSVIRRCKEKGLKFGLWFEPEMVNEDSDLFREHPDYAISKIGEEPTRGRTQLVLDFTRKEVVDCVFRMMADILKKHDISYVKWDMNRNLSEYYSAALPASRQGEFSHRYILGVYDLASRLIEAFPDLFIEGCASGGGRFDAGMLYYFPQIWTSDDTDAYERAKIQWGTATCYPVSSMSCHVAACPNHQTQRITPFSTRGAIASLGATGYELDLSKMTGEEKELTKKQVENYKRIQDLVLHGDLYRLQNPFEENYFCEMLVSKDKKQAYLVAERIHGVPCDYSVLFRLRGLDENVVYHIEELGLNASGKVLMSSGILSPKLPDYGSVTMHFTAI